VYHTKKFTVDNHIGINSLYIYISNSDEIIIDLCNIDSYESYKMGGGGGKEFMTGGGMGKSIPSQ